MLNNFQRVKSYIHCPDFGDVDFLRRNDEHHQKPPSRVISPHLLLLKIPWRRFCWQHMQKFEKVNREYISVEEGFEDWVEFFGFKQRASFHQGNRSRCEFGDPQKWWVLHLKFIEFKMLRLVFGVICCILTFH